jgi:hypothetical protein
VGNVKPIRLDDRAMENIRFIRSAMERAGSFTAVPGLGGIAMGATALPAAWLASRQTDAQGWLAVWCTEVVVAGAIGSLAMAHKARRSGTPLWNAAGRKFLMAFAPPLLVGALLTWPLFAAGMLNVLTAAWLLLYGVGIISAGAYSVSIVPSMGVAYFALGLVALLTPPHLRDLPLAAGFGGLHIIFGFWIYRRYGG